MEFHQIPRSRTNGNLRREASAATPHDSCYSVQDCALSEVQGMAAMGYADLVSAPSCRGSSWGYEGVGRDPFTVHQPVD